MRFLKYAISLILLLSFSSLSFGQELSQEDAEIVDCLAAENTFLVVGRLMLDIKNGNPLPNSEELANQRRDTLTSGAQKLDALFPNSSEHVAEYYSASGRYLGVFMDMLKTGETQGMVDFSARVKSCPERDN